jgi:hypothetical protein
MPRNTDQGPAIDPAEISRHVSEATGVPLTMIEKPFALLPSDLQVLHPADAQRVLDQSGLNAETKRWLVASMGEPIVLEPATRHEIPEEITEEHDDEFVQRYQFRSDQQMMLIGASMGLGKTHQLREYLKLNPHLKRVLIITARQQQAYSAKGVYADVAWTDCMHGFHMYLDHPSGSLCGFDKLVVQYESLHRLLNFEGEIESYDLIIIEARSVLGQAQCAVTNQDRLLLNYEIAEGLIKECKSILMDADMEVDAAVWDFVSQHLPQERIRFHRYTHVAFRREIIVVSEPEWLRMAAEDLTNGKKIGLPFRSKVKMNDVLAMDEFQRHRAIKFDSDSSKDHMEKLLEIDRNLEDVDMMAFTSKITAGADIQTNFEAVYVHGTAAAGPTPRDTLQMIGRFRKVTSNRVVCVLPDVRDAALGVNYESEKDTILKRKDLAIHQQQVLAARGMVRAGNVLRFLPHPLVGLTVHARVESNYCFSTAFLNQVRRKGWRINLHIPVSDDIKEEEDIIAASLEATSAERKQDQEDYRLGVAEKVQMMTPEERKVESERLRTLDAAHELSSTERVMKNTLHVALRLPPDSMRTLDSTTLSFAAADISAVYRVSTVIRHAREEQDIADATALARAPAGEHAKFRGTGARAILAVLRLMGLNGPSDTVSRARLVQFNSSSRLALVAKCREVFQLLDQRVPRVAKSTQEHITLSRNVLRLMRVALKAKQVMEGNNRVREYRIEEECEGFLDLVTAFNPYPRGPPTPSDVPYGRHARAVRVLTSNAVEDIFKRELSLVDPLPVTAPLVVTGFVTCRVAGPAAAQMQQGSPPPSPTCRPRVPAVATPTDADIAEFQSEHIDGDASDEGSFHGLGCYADDGWEMQDDSDCMAD